MMTQARHVDKDYEQWLMYRNLEDEHLSLLKKYSDTELLQIFPEVKPTLHKKIQEWIAFKKVVRKSVLKKLGRIKANAKSDFENWICRELVKHSDGQLLLDANKHIMRLNRQIYIASGKQLKGHLADEQIEIAGQVLIADLYDGRLRRSGNNLIGQCPFHEDKRPSFTVYSETNSCWCFGCQQGGNSIKFIMLLHGYTFPEAVKYLLGL